MPNIRSAEDEPLLPRAAQAARRLTRSSWEEFREFIDRGKVLDLAVGIIIGASFTGIVKSIADDLLSPLLSLIIKHQLSKAFFILRSADLDSEGCEKHREWCENPKTPQQAQEVGAITLNYGHCIEQIINFFLIAIMLFLIIKAYVKITHKRSKYLKKYIDCPYCTEEIPQKAKRCKFCCKDIELEHMPSVMQ
ncbi:large-conductance mechanosensitive channel [Phlyctochytrium arcticum]|nr:large-conductance mechanosensitive channel [Phlyctochytrium arcticum]